MISSRKPGNVILLTKFNRPGVTKDLVVRPQLLKLLDSGIEGPLTLVVAPAGFGKTTLVSSWIETLGDGEREDRPPIPAAWLSLDESDNDRDVFLHYFIASLRTIFPDACPETLELLNARQQPPSSLLVDMLSNELESLPTRFVIALDDLNSPHSQGVFDFLTSWMRHWPRPMHLVILSRFNPPLPLAALRARGQLTEIRLRDLRFTPMEAAEYYRLALGIFPDEAIISVLQQLLEGWIAGLKMATLSLREHSDLQALASGLLDGDVYIADYLMEEVLSRQSPTMQLFLLKTSITDQFCPSLCEALIDSREPGGARAYIDQLESADLFVTALDNHQEWYRFHEMFREMLRQRVSSVLTPDQVYDLHVCAANWLADHNLMEPAIHHALKIGNLDLAVQFMQQGLCDILNQEDITTLDRWLGLLPEDFIRQSPQLLVMRAWGHGFRWELGLLASAVEQAESLLDENDRSDQMQLVRGQIAVLKGQSFYHINQLDRAVAFCLQGLALLPEQWRYVRGVAGSFVGMGLYAIGRADDAEKYLVEQYESARDKTDGYALRLLLALAINFLQAGNYENAERTARTILRQARQSQLTVMGSWGHYLLGFVHYQWDNLDVAARHFTEVVDLFLSTQWAAARNGMIGQSFVLQALGQPADAVEAIDQLSRIDLDYRGREEIDTTAARARLMYLQGDLEGAERWANIDVAPPDDQPLQPWMEVSQLTRARILIAGNKAADVQLALQILDTMQVIAGRTFNIRLTIEILALRALAQLTQGDSAGARESLIRSLELSRHGGFTRVFVDLGPQMQKLLHQIAGHQSVSKTVSRILAAFSGADAPPIDGASTNGTAAHQSASPGESPNERLTPRELDVLLLMAEPISLKDIATRLNISYATTRRYTINIYDKFGVHSRWEAVDFAIQKGIISPPRILLTGQSHRPY